MAGAPGVIGAIDLRCSAACLYAPRVTIATFVHDAPLRGALLVAARGRRAGDSLWF